jgi:anti-sigma-K factor RskA
MTDHTENSRLDEDLALAGELALRVLSPEDEAAARARASAEPAFATHVEAWNERLGGLGLSRSSRRPGSGRGSRPV